MIYIAINKDNKDALMHYGVKGMRWGKRGGRRAGEETIPEDTIEEQFIYEDYASNSPKNHHRRPGKGYKTTSRKKNNISTGSRPQQNKISTSQQAPYGNRDRVKQYLRDQAEREKVDERKEQYQQEQQRRADLADARKRQQNWKNIRFKTKDFHTMLTGNTYYGKKYSIKDPGVDMWQREHAGEKNPFRSDRSYSHNYYEARKSKIRRR